MHKAYFSLVCCVLNKNTINLFCLICHNLSNVFLIPLLQDLIQELKKQNVGLFNEGPLVMGEGRGRGCVDPARSDEMASL